MIGIPYATSFVLDGTPTVRCPKCQSLFAGDQFDLAASENDPQKAAARAYALHYEVAHG